MANKKTELEKRAQARLQDLASGEKTQGMDDYHMENGHIVRNKPKTKMSKKERRRQRQEAFDRYWD